MKVLKIQILITSVLLINLLFMCGFSTPERAKILNEDEVISLAVDSNESSLFYAASRDSVYKTNNSGKDWHEVFHIGKPSKKINRIYLDRIEPSAIYVLTQEGLYRSEDGEGDWQRIFTGSSDLGNNCLCLLSMAEALFLGTEEGLFISHNQGKTWQKSFDQFSDSVISSIVSDGEAIYLASQKGVFISEDNAKSWKRIYVVYGSEIAWEDFDDYDGEISDYVLAIKTMIISNNGLYIATSKGLFFTEDKGRKWQNITKTGLASLHNIRSMLVADGQLYLVTDKGLFRLDNNFWRRIQSSMDLHDLDLDQNKDFLVAGKGGVYRLSQEEVVLKGNKSAGEVNYSKEDIQDLFAGEPTIEQVQGAAMEYSETNMNKIKSWRRQARLRALFPSFSLGYNKSIYGSSSGAMAVGPRDWDIAFSWDVGDLVWNSDQTSIDSRSRLTVQLRQDVLDQLNSLYYERRRLKAEMLLSPPVDDVEELYRDFEIQQLTANIDALTGNFFSRVLRRKDS